QPRDRACAEAASGRSGSAQPLQRACAAAALALGEGAPPTRAPDFDWFFGFEEARGLLLPLLEEGAEPSSSSSSSSPPAPLGVLDVGCGTSGLGPGLYAHCPLPLDVLAVDVDGDAVARARRLFEAGGRRPVRAGHPASRLRFARADGRALGPACPPASRHVVVDKGTWDAVRRADGPAGAERLLAECLRVLRPRGTLVQLTDEDPDARLPCLERRAGRRPVTVHPLGPFGGVAYFAYLVRPLP
uniref:Methyltransferase domain-containing protein n=1 Tax=Ornithorhynchus anatinus TaxID=9258 RepID=A0A6I8NZ69_ORNAN